MSGNMNCKHEFFTKIINTSTRIINEIFIYVIHILYFLFYLLFNKILILKFIY